MDLPWLWDLGVSFGIGEGFLLAGLARTRVAWSNLKKYVYSPIATLGVLAAAATEVGILGISSDSWLHLPATAAAIAGTGYLGGKLWARKRPAGIPSVERQRGTEIRDAPSPQPTRGLGRARDQRITLAGVPLELEDEVRHFKIIGVTGTGKSTAITEMLEKALARGDRIIVADPDGGYMSKFYDPSRGDKILNPFRQDSVRWSLLNEIRDPDIDIADMARAFIPDRGGSHDDFWTNSARTLFTEVTRYGLAKGIKTDAELYKLMTSASDDELKDILKGAPYGTPVDPLLKEGNERMFGSIRGVATLAFEKIQHTMQRQGELLSIRDWVKQVDDPSQKGVLFIPYSAKEISTLGSMVSAWMRIGIFETLSQPENPDRRLWFVVDELDALGPIDGMKDAIARLRKFGGRMVIGFQSIAQVSGTYGMAAAKTIVENARNTLILNSSDSERGGTADFASRLIGNAEVLEKTYSRTVGSADLNESQRFAIRPAVLPAEIEQLPDLHGYLKIVSKEYWMRVKLTLKDIKSKYATAAASVSPAAASSASPSPLSTAAAAPTAAPVAPPTPPAAGVPPPAKRARAPKKNAAAAKTRRSQPATTTTAESTALAATPSSSASAAVPSATTSKPAASGSKGAATTSDQKPEARRSGGEQSGQQSLPLGPAASSAAATTAATTSTSKSPPPQAAAPPKKRPAGSQSADSSAASTAGLSREISPPIVKRYETYRSQRVQQIEAALSNDVSTISSTDNQKSKTSTSTSTADPPSSPPRAREDRGQDDILSYQNLVEEGFRIEGQDEILIKEVRERAARAWDSRTNQHEQQLSPVDQQLSSGSEDPAQQIDSQGHGLDQGYDASS